MIDPKEVIEIGHDLFFIDIKKDGARYSGDVYPVTKWHGIAVNEAGSESGSVSGFGYESKTEGGLFHVELNDDVKVLFSFLITWRGVWDDRLYFSLDEYDGDELETMLKVWVRIREDLRAKIRSENPKIHD